VGAFLSPRHANFFTGVDIWTVRKYLPGRTRVPLAEEWEAMQRRRGIRQTQSLEDRLTAEAKELRETARWLPPSPDRQAMLRKARQDEIAAHLTEWLTSPGLRPPD
jgi:hypothetical protein